MVVREQWDHICWGFSFSTRHCIQNFPEGAIVSKPLLGEGVPKVKTFRKHSNIGTISFAAGFILMTALDVGLG